MSKKINVQGFVDQFTNASEEEKINLIKSVMVMDKTLSMMEKQVMCQNILKIAHTTEDGKVWMNSCKEHLVYVYMLLDIYSILEVHATDFASEYALLDQCGVVEVLLASIDSNEKAKFDCVLNMCKNDFLDNYCSLSSIVNKMIGSLSIMEEFISKQE